MNIYVINCFKSQKQYMDANKGADVHVSVCAFRTKQDVVWSRNWKRFNKSVSVRFMYCKLHLTISENLDCVPIPPILDVYARTG